MARRPPDATRSVAAADFEGEVEVEVQVLFQGPHSRAIGREVHQQLAALPWNEPPTDPRLLAVYGSDLWRRAAASADARREVPLSCPLSDGVWREGVADLVSVRGTAGWWWDSKPTGPPRIPPPAGGL